MNEQRTVRLRGSPGVDLLLYLHPKGTLRRDVGGGQWWEEKGEAETDSLLQKVRCPSLTCQGDSSCSRLCDARPGAGGSFTTGLWAAAPKLYFYLCH